MDSSLLVCLGCGEDLDPPDVRQIERPSGVQASICPTCGCDGFRLDGLPAADIDTDTIPSGVVTSSCSVIDD